MTEEPPFHDMELVCLDLLADVGGPITTVTHTDENLTAPCIQVQMTDGPDDGVTQSSVMQVTCFGRTREEATLLSRQVTQKILAASGTAVTGQYVTGALLDRTRTLSSGRDLPYEDRDVRRFVSEHLIEHRRPY